MLSKEIMIGTERRQFQRYSAPESAFALLRAGHEKLGQIKNISKGGLAFEYTPDENHKNSVESELSRKIDIFIFGDKIFGDNFRLSTIPCKIIYDGDTVPDHSIITSIPMRRCGVQFGNLNPEAAGLLDSCLTRCEL